MSFNIRAYQPLDHPVVSFPERDARHEGSTDAPEMATHDERAKFLEDWRRMLDKHLQQNKKDEEDSPVMGLSLVRELDAI
ncbi:MAG: hypothetical protein A2X86_02505 [Bdellovibrionales bacterium GWA2_49_15]|nr:MAG: hypothetical protein A2X86_02505 [Bdellovibrionales bacterium GWA2_49_15]